LHLIQPDQFLIHPGADVAVGGVFDQDVADKGFGLGVLLLPGEQINLPELEVGLLGCVGGDRLGFLQEAGGVSPLDAPPIQRRLEAHYAEGWFRNVMADAFT